uniref:Si:dkeyp-104b3.18 n=1 Tax=Cyprinus carpio TaxID=7962 RepID=A0A8C1NJ09_CYPCA
MAAYAKTKIFYISIGFWLILGVESYDDWSNNVLTVQTGGSVTIPCYYDKKYTQQKKYWFSEIDKTYKNTSEENLSIIDHPDQSLFTVTMRNLQDKHNGDYYCVVETGEQPSTKIIYEPYLKIQSGKTFCNCFNQILMSNSLTVHMYFIITNKCCVFVCVCSVPGVSVVNSSVSGHEGGDISVQCVYSSDYQNKLKQWCRYKDQSCYTVGRTDTSQNSSVQISDDDGRRSFTVLMTGLRLTDSGWYWCSAGDALSPVHLTVTEAEPHKEKDTSVFKHFSLTSLLSELFCICLHFVVMHSISLTSFAFHSNNHFLIAFVILPLCVFFIFAEVNQDMTRIIIQLKSLTNHKSTTSVLIKIK